MPSFKHIFLISIISFWSIVIVEQSMKSRFESSPWRPSYILSQLSGYSREFFSILGKITVKILDIPHLIRDLFDILCQYLPVKDFLDTAYGIFWQFFVLISSPLWYLKGYIEALSYIEYGIIIICLTIILFVGLGAMIANGTVGRMINVIKRKTRGRYVGQQNRQH